MSYINDLRARLRYLKVEDPLVLSIVDDIEKDFNEKKCIDQLTGLPNKYGFIAYLENQLSRLDQSSLNNPTMYVAFGDLDNLTAINNQFGHNEGDNAIKHVANVIQKAVRVGDFVSRFYGHGDEFVFVFTRMSDQANAEATKNRIKRALNSNPFRVGRQKVVLSMSIGVIPCSPNLSVEEHISLADEAMYIEKGLSHNARAQISTHD